MDQPFFRDHFEAAAFAVFGVAIACVVGYACFVMLRALQIYRQREDGPCNGQWRVTLILDEDDYTVLFNEAQRWNRMIDRGYRLPEGNSNRVGAIVGEALRSLEDYRGQFVVSREDVP